MDNVIKILSPLNVIQQPNKTFASDSLEVPAGVQPDLLYMKSVLVSTGQNKNDDVFLPEEMWAARHTPVLKPVDWEHNTGSEIILSANEELANPKEIVRGNQIIGAMYNSYVADKDGVIISESKANADDFEIPQEFDIINEAVIYKYLFPKVSERIVSQASSNGLFVSMEAWFNSFDYRLGNKIIARNEDTAFLDAHLKSNGGDGFFSGEKVGRVLRNIVFGGVGIVSNPANDDSIIQSFTNADLKNTDVTNMDSAVASNIMGVLNSDSEESQEVYEIMSSSKTENTAPVTQVAVVNNEDYKDVVQRLVKAEHTIEVKDKELETAQVKITELEENKDNLTSSFAKGVATVAEVLGPDNNLSTATAENFFDLLAQTLTNKLSSEEDAKAKLVEAEEKLQALEEAKTLAERKDKIRDGLGLVVSSEDTDEIKKSKADRVENLVKATESFNAEAFTQWLEETTALLTLAAGFPFGKKDDEDKDKDKDKKDKKADKSKADEGITDVAVLDTVQAATASVPAGVDGVAGEPSGPERWQALAADLIKATKKVIKED